MEVKLKSLKFYGFRTFSDDSEVHEINFDKKLTIIHGRNGSGKTVNKINKLYKLGIFN